MKIHKNPVKLLRNNGARKLIRITLIAIPAIALVIAGALWYASKNAPSASAGWWNDNWSYRKALVINHNKVTGDLTDFPVLVSLTDASLSTHAQEDGDDFKFLLSGTNEVLSHEIEKYASSTGELVAWVKVPTLSSTEDTVIYMYYGNAGVGSQEDAENVWVSNYKGVWHLNNATDASSTDSSLYGNTGTMVGSMAASSTGKIDGGLASYGNGDYINVANSPSLQISGNFTVSFWLKTDDFNSTWQTTVFDMSDWGNKTGWSFMDDGDGLNSLLFRVEGGGTSYDCEIPRSSVNDGNWHYIVGRRSGSTIYCYVDNVQKDSTGSTVMDINTTSDMTIGNNWETAVATVFLDEAQVSDIDRGTDWIETSYNNQNSPAAFFAEQAEETGPGPVGYWTFDEGLGTTAYDESGQGNDGTIAGAAWQDESMCVSGKCLYFDGTDDYVNIPECRLPERLPNHGRRLGKKHL